MAYEVTDKDGSEIHSDDYARLMAAALGYMSVDEANRVVDEHEDFTLGAVTYEWCDEDYLWEEEIGEHECGSIHQYVVIDGKTVTTPDGETVVRGKVIDSTGHPFGTLMRNGYIVGSRH